MFCVIIPTFVEVSGKKLADGAFFYPTPPFLIGLKITKKNMGETKRKLAQKARKQIHKR